MTPRALALLFPRRHPPSSWRRPAWSGIRVRRASKPGAAVRRLARRPPRGGAGGLRARRAGLRLRRLEAAAEVGPVNAAAARAALGAGPRAAQAPRAAVQL